MPKPVTYCSVSDCNEPCKGHDLCAKHYMRNLRRGTTDLVPYAKPRVLGKCASCDRDARIRDMCAVHYQRWIRTTRRENACIVEGCDRGQYSNRMCHLHYQRFSKYGSTDSRQRSAHDRFWEKVNKEGPIPDFAPHLGPCWIWTAALNVGYGAFGAGQGRAVGAHVWAFEEANGPVTKGLHLDHLCRVTACVRPSHLEPVPPRENMRRGFAAELGPAPHCPTCSCGA
jgi:hypothetical protein